MRPDVARLLLPYIGPLVGLLIAVFVSGWIFGAAYHAASRLHDRDDGRAG